jgi:hypothetical protein
MPPTGPRNPEESLLYQVVAGELETFLAAQRDHERQVPRFIEKEFRSFSIAACSPVASSGSLATPAGWTASWRSPASPETYARLVEADGSRIQQRIW